MKLFALLFFFPLTTLAAGNLQTLDRDQEFASFMASVNLESDDYQLTYKNSGTSVGMKVEKNGKKVGKWVPANSATNPEAQVVSYLLGRYLQMSEQVVPSAYYVAGPRAIEAFRSMLENALERNRDRIANREANLNSIYANPNAMLGVYTAPIKHAEVEELENPAANTINRAHPIARDIRADQPMPTNENQISFRGLKTKSGKRPVAPELELAREFSRIMVLDILTGQWDRWSGGNVEVTMDASGRAILLARDNGGASLRGTSHMAKYFGIVSRFDRAQIEKVRSLLEDLDQDTEGTTQLLGLRSGSRSLRARAAALLQQVSQLVATYGESAVFFPN